MSHAEFRALRDAGALPFDSLPVLELADGTVIGQSNTLLRYAGRLAGLMPPAPSEALRVEALLDSAEDFGGRVSSSIRTPTRRCASRCVTTWCARGYPSGAACWSAASRSTEKAGWWETR